MGMIISLQKSTDSQSLDVYQEILNNKNEFENDGIQIIDAEQEALAPGFFEGIIIGIIGGVAVHYIVKIIDFVIEKIKERKYYNMSFIIIYQGKAFLIPENRDECISFFQEIEKGEEDV